MITLARINAMPLEQFVDAFGDVAEHSPWVAREAAAHRPFNSRDAMIGAFEKALRAAGRDAQLELLRAHPDLATRARLTHHSTKEQAGVGLDMLEPVEFARFNGLNSRYKERFGFPFIFAVRGATKHMILKSFELRINNTPEEEFEMALTQVVRIFGFRISDRLP